VETPLDVFFSYAHEDEDLMNDVRRQLIAFERNRRILKWHDRMIPPGTEWRGQIDSRLALARIVLLFMSPHFIESRYCYEIEGEAALQRHAAGTARVVPIILRPCPWEVTPFGALQALPTNGKPISMWTNRDEACLDAARGVMRIADALSASRRKGDLTVGALAPGGSSRAKVVDETASRAKLAYCSRCGMAAGKQSTCTGVYTHHQFATGSSNDYCGRCGVRPGAQTSCTGVHTHHQFSSGGTSTAICSRCGVEAGSQSTCTGTYTHHSFFEIK
jgi:hypothetical protein